MSSLLVTTDTVPLIGNQHDTLTKAVSLLTQRDITKTIALPSSLVDEVLVEEFTKYTTIVLLSLVPRQHQEHENDQEIANCIKETGKEFFHVWVSKG